MTAVPAERPVPPARRPIRAVVLAHFDPDGRFDAHVHHALAAYRHLADQLVVVSNSAPALPRELTGLVDEFLPRHNVGYDFAAWQTGLASLRPAAFDEVICVNDSVYGPLFDLAPAFDDPRVAGADLWGMVLSDQNTSRAAPRVPHLQSWFLGMRRSLLESDAWAAFWRGLEPVPTKRDVVTRHEIGFSARMAAAGFRLAALYDATKAPPVRLREVWPHLSARHPRRSWRLLRKSRRIPHNPSELTWWRLWEAGVPYLKVGLLRVNHYGLDVGRVLAELEQWHGYDAGLIHRHLGRCGRGHEDRGGWLKIGRLVASRAGRYNFPVDFRPPGDAPCPPVLVGRTL